MNKFIERLVDRAGATPLEEASEVVTELETQTVDTLPDTLTGVSTEPALAVTPRRWIVRVEFGLLSVLFYAGVGWLIYQRVVKPRRQASLVEATA